MNTAATNQLNPCPTSEALQPKVLSMDGWLVREYNKVSSTNLMAVNLPAWTAIRAETQTAGRGRFQRNWVSDQGGLWLSAVLPTGNTAEWRALPLAVGLAVCNALREIETPALRKRWPNDIIVCERKLAGLLIDQFSPGLAVAGIGINVSNQPEECDSSLNQQTMRLADVLPSAPSLEQLTQVVLRHLRTVVHSMQSGGFRSLYSQINLLWGPPRRVELDLDGIIRRGMFTSVDETGRLILSDESGKFIPYDTHQVRHLTEI